MDVVRRLKEIQYLEFSSKSESSSGWSGLGKGRVDTEEQEASLIYKEKGVWISEAGKEISFKNTYRWTFEESQIRLEHLRFGEDQPVHLFYLKEESDGLWMSVCPHVCDRDLYSAIMKLEENCILLSWRIKGPEKDERIRYKYY